MTKADGRQVIMGKLFYRARMRKPLDEALKWLNRKKDVADKNGSEL